jgi:hypothetical protein
MRGSSAIAAFADSGALALRTRRSPIYQASCEMTFPTGLERARGTKHAIP